eukprot:IDg15508t1
MFDVLTAVRIQSASGTGQWHTSAWRTHLRSTLSFAARATVQYKVYTRASRQLHVSRECTVCVCAAVYGYHLSYSAYGHHYINSNYRVVGARSCACSAVPSLPPYYLTAEVCALPTSAAYVRVSRPATPRSRTSSLRRARLHAAYAHWYGLRSKVHAESMTELATHLEEEISITDSSQAKRCYACLLAMGADVVRRNVRPANDILEDVIAKDSQPDDLCELALIFRATEGVVSDEQRVITLYEPKELDLLERAVVVCGRTGAMRALAHELHGDDDSLVPDSGVRAMRLYERAAALGDVDSERARARLIASADAFALAALLQTVAGTDVPADLRHAGKLYRRAVDLDDSSQAAINLAIMLGRGDAVPRDEACEAALLFLAVGDVSDAEANVHIVCLGCK